MMTLIVSLPLTGVVEFVNAYIYSDWEYAKSICVMVVIDTIMSIAKHIMRKDASSEAFWKGFSNPTFTFYSRFSC